MKFLKNCFKHRPLTIVQYEHHISLSVHEANVNFANIYIVPTPRKVVFCFGRDVPSPHRFELIAPAWLDVTCMPIKTRLAEVIVGL